ncbi:MAG: CDP-diacylglycerol--glycerol-3-phosphate 3-phosphatidyltransferase [Deltaproteobacteria bacterium]
MSTEGALAPNPTPRRRKGALRHELGNLPNLLTLARVAVIPPFVLFTYYADPLHSFLAALIFSLAAATDVLDGFLARRLGLVTVMGKFMDPLADKLIVMAALVMLVRLGRVASVVVILILAREFVVSGLRTIAISEGMVIDASQGGKWKTSLQVTGIASLLIHYTHEVGFLVAQAPIDFDAIGTWLLYLSVVSSYVSAYGYFRAFWRGLAEA